LGDAPALFVKALDTCELCNVAMRTVANDSLLVCPSCNMTRVHTVFGGAHSAGMDCGELGGGAASGGASTANAATRTKLMDELDCAQGKDVAEAAPDTIAGAAEQLVLDKATGLEDVADLIAAERDKGPFVSYENALERLKGPMAERGVDLEARLRSLDAAVVKSALMASFKRTRSASVHAYSRATKVAAALSGLQPPRMTMQQETRLRRLFSLAEPLFLAHKTGDRSGFPFGYPAFLRATCVLLGWDEFVDLFPLGSASEKTAADREALHARVFAQLGWEYTPMTARVSGV
jgi:hypothetical protein